MRTYELIMGFLIEHIGNYLHSVFDPPPEDELETEQVDEPIKPRAQIIEFYPRKVQPQKIGNGAEFQQAIKSLPRKQG